MVGVGGPNDKIDIFGDRGAICDLYQHWCSLRPLVNVFGVFDLEPCIRCYNHRVFALCLTL